MDWKEYRRKQLQPHSFYYSDIWIDKLRKTMKNLNQIVSGQKFELMTSHIYSRNNALSTATMVTMVPMTEEW
jgi:hypothetical protein